MHLVGFTVEIHNALMAHDVKNCH